MKLFDLTCDVNNYASFLFKDVSESLKWGEGWFEGTPRGSSYPIPLGVRNREGDGLRSDVLPDFTQIGLRPIPTFGEHAVELLGSVLHEHGELAPIQMDEPVHYFGFNPTTIVDVLDEGRSQIKRFTDGEVMRVERHVLRDSVSSLPLIFKMPQTRRNTTYVNEAFVAFVEKSGLTGFRFELLFER